MNIFLKEFMAAARETPRMYFAIFIGAYRGIRSELRAIENDSNPVNGKSA